MVGLCALGYSFHRRPSLPELDWSLGKGTLLVDGIRLGMTPVQAYSAMGESGGQLPEHVYTSADKRTFFIGGSLVIEVASFDCLILPDGKRISAGDTILSLASLWPLRYRPERNAFAPFSLEVSKGGRWYEGAGNLWVYANQQGRLEYFDLSRDARQAMGGPNVSPPPTPAGAVQTAP